MLEGSVKYFPQKTSGKTTSAITAAETVKFRQESFAWIEINGESGEIYDTQKHGALDCQAKVREGTINYGQYFRECKFIPGDPGSHFPNAYFKIQKKNVTTNKVEEGIPPIPEKLFK